MIKVFFETEKGSFAEEVATFRDEELFMDCLPALEKQAKKERYVVTESCGLDEVEETKELLKREGYIITKN